MTVTAAANAVRQSLVELRSAPIEDGDEGQRRELGDGGQRADGVGQRSAKVERSGGAEDPVAVVHAEAIQPEQDRRADALELEMALWPEC